MDVSTYLEHLSDTDMALLARLAGEASTERWLASVRAEPRALQDVLADPATYAALFAGGEESALLRASPFLLFAATVHAGVRDLARAAFVEEWIGPGRRVPMFEVQGLRDFAADGVHRLFLAELLASYTHVASGSYWTRTQRGWRRQRFSELDPLRLIQMLGVVPEAERPALYRRLGDLALFVTGVFPDYAGSYLQPGKRRRILERLRWVEVGPAPAVADDMALLESIGREAYRMASRANGHESAGAGRVLQDAANGFGDARRLLNFVTDRYLFPHRERWFPSPQG